MEGFRDLTQADARHSILRSAQPCQTVVSCDVSNLGCFGVSVLRLGCGLDMALGGLSYNECICLWSMLGGLTLQTRYILNLKIPFLRYY